jgi:alanine racemase
VEVLGQAAQRLGARPQPIHLKIDTGMGRLGVTLAELALMCRIIKRSGQVVLEGVSTHFASSEVLDAPETQLQIENFERALHIVKEEGLAPELCHMDNTGGILARPDTWKNMVRPGIALYGYSLPLRRTEGLAERRAALSLQPALTWTTRVISVRQFGAGRAIGYGGTYTTAKPSRIAVLPVGYADGYRRALSNRGRVILGSAYAPIVGSVSMDLTLVDVTEIPEAAVGDDVVLIGSRGSLRVDAAEVADLCGTVPYEILCGISKRVPRVHLP